MNVPDLWQGDITIYSGFHNSIAPQIFLEIMVIIKFESHHATPLICDWIEYEWCKKKRKLKKNPNWPTQKTEFFNSANSQYFFAKISGIAMVCSLIYGGCRMQNLSISQVIDHVICYKSSALIGWNYSI